LTEWYNAQTGGNLSCVYTYDGSILRDASSSDCGISVRESSADGFRLPGLYEYQLAAAYRGDDTVNTANSPMDGVYWTARDSASGATADISDTDATGEVAWHSGNSGNITHEVKGKTPNTLGFYDLSGNVEEYIDSAVTPRYLVVSGSAFGLGEYSLLAIGAFYDTGPLTSSYFRRGFRVAQSQ
jgi:formylglycine-generating enzyme required for sulfatase activity